MSNQQTIHIAVRAPDEQTRSELLRVLGRDPAIDVSEMNGVRPDITLMHSALVEPGTNIALRADAQGRIIVTSAQTEPGYLAGLLASGAYGYHCTGEPWEILIDVIHRVYRGEARSDPKIMDQLLVMYRQLARQVKRRP